MDEHSLETQLNKLVEEFGGQNSSSSRKLAEVANSAKQYSARLNQSVNGVQDSLDYLRICVKYLIFDLEATKRENKCLRQMLEEKE